MGDTLYPSAGDGREAEMPGGEVGDWLWEVLGRG